MMNQMILPTINNFDFNTPCNLNIQPLNFYSSQQQAFIEMNKDAKAIESGKFKLTINKQINPQAISLINNLRILSHQNMFSNPACEINPYLQVLFDESQNHIHSTYWSGQMPNLSYQDYFIGSFNRIGEALTKNKCALKCASWRKELAIQTNQQKTNTDKLLKKYKQMKCEYIELPFVPDRTLCVNLTLEQKEASYPTVLKSFLKMCHGAEGLQGTLCDMQWRFVKGLDGVPTAHILMYVVGDDINYAPLLSNSWNKVCIEKGLCTHSSQIQIRSIHCYQGNGLASKHWKNLIDSCQAPLEFYRYKVNGLSHVWKSYTGNI
ncbi:conserved hypothetical protein [Acinetobacter sp. 8I-beige]|nr:conserved hypothetical protein [Acinetobacter sp. 8I-beige]